jgi:hypothetical protein
MKKEAAITRKIGGKRTVQAEKSKGGGRENGTFRDLKELLSSWVLSSGKMEVRVRREVK